MIIHRRCGMPVDPGSLFCRVVSEQDGYETPPAEAILVVYAAYFCDLMK